jgi:hypothetical protein
MVDLLFVVTVTARTQEAGDRAEEALILLGPLNQLLLTFDRHFAAVDGLALLALS